MSNMQKQLKKLKFDRRMTNYSLKTGELSKDELAQHLKSLDDCADRAKSIKVAAAAAEGQNIN